LNLVETSYMLDGFYIKFHKNFNVKIRKFVVKYIYKIFHKFALKRTTLFLAIYYMDKYLAKEYSDKEQSIYIIIAQSSLFIAMKY
jgi:hypothetical protein